MATASQALPRKAYRVGVTMSIAAVPSSQCLLLVSLPSPICSPSLPAVCFTSSPALVVCFTVLGGTARAHRTPAQKRAGFPGTNIEKGSRVAALLRSPILCPSLPAVAVCCPPCLSPFSFLFCIPPCGCCVLAPMSNLSPFPSSSSWSTSPLTQPPPPCVTHLLVNLVD